MENPPSRRLGGTTFIELVVTIFLLAAIATLAFSLYWSASKASAANEIENAALRARLTLVTMLPRATSSIRPPYWGDPERIFTSSGGSLSADYFDGAKGSLLVIKRLNDSGIAIVSPDLEIGIGDLPGVSIDWWKNEGRIIGVVVGWRQGKKTNFFHAAWGAFVL